MFLKNNLKKIQPAQTRGFTLIEMLIIIVIIGVLATIASISMKSARSKAMDAKKVSDIRVLQSGLEMYMLDEGQYPTGIQANWGKPLVGPTSGKTYMILPKQLTGNSYGDYCKGIDSIYDYSSVSNNTYTVKYCLDNPMNGCAPGPKTAIPNLIMNCEAAPASTCVSSCLGRCSGELDNCGTTICSAPTVPSVTGLTANPSSGQLTINWTAVAGASSYDVCVKAVASGNCTNTDFSATNNSTTNSYVKTGLTNGTTYNIAVRANLCSNATIGANPNSQITVSLIVLNACTAPTRTIECSVTTNNNGDICGGG